MNELDNAIYLLGRVILSASRQDALASRVDLGAILSALGEIPDVASDGAMAWMEVQRQCSLAITALDSCRRPPTERPVRREELIADARARAVACIRHAHELACGRSGG